MQRTRTQRDGRRATQYLLRWLGDGEGNKEDYDEYSWSSGQLVIWSARVPLSAVIIINHVVRVPYSP